MKKYTKRRKVFGVGNNDADYMVYECETIGGKRKIIWRCPFYLTWANMLRRCYSEKALIRNPTYKGCTVFERWLIFSNFKAWMETQDWKGKQLDKDLLVKGNKVYSPDNCIFVHPKVNTFTTDHGNARGEYMIGVYWSKNAGKFMSQCGNPFTGKQEYLGCFTNELEAHLAWKRKKHEHACALADSEYCTDPRLAEILRTRYLGDFTND